MNEPVKTIVLSAGIFAIATAGNIASKSLYTNSKLGVDQRALIISSLVAIGAGYFVLKNMK
jgi:hypothetical protein